MTRELIRVVGILLAASRTFATPVASPTNSLVQRAGYYTMSKCAKVGVPLSFITLLSAIMVLPVFFSF